jgi:hypothetical protein
MLHRSNRLCQRAITSLRPAVRAIASRSTLVVEALVEPLQSQALPADEIAPV